MNLEELFLILGGKDNILAATNCMTRLRITVQDDCDIDDSKFNSLDEVLGVVHDTKNYFEIVVGPGKSRKYADLCHRQGIPSAPPSNPSKNEANSNIDKTSASHQAEAATDDWRTNKTQIKSKQKNGKIKGFLKIFGEIFVPLIPGSIAAGLCAGIAMLISQINPNYEQNTILNILHQMLTVVNLSFMTYISAWAGMRAAERFGATPILGGMLGLITSLENIDAISKTLGLFNDAVPLDSILRAGKGGVLAAIAGAYLLSIIEKKIRKHMPNSLDIVFTPILSLFLCLVPYIFILMPGFGLISKGICWFFGIICLSPSPIIRGFAGFLGATFFLPLVATGMHHGLIALYTVQLQQLGYVTLYPTLAMAGAGQVGAGIALYIRARKNNIKLANIIKGALPAGILGIGEPLIYGVTLPLGKPFITAGIGAGFGGALIMISEVASTTWGPSGILGVFVMTAGPNGAIGSILIYLLGLFVSCVAGGLITYFTIKPKTFSVEAPANEPENLNTNSSDSTLACKVNHTDIVLIPNCTSCVSYTITDINGIHARPAAKLVDIAKQFESDISICANEKEIALDSVMKIMKLNIKYKTTITFKATGIDQRQALCALYQFTLENL